MWAFAVVMVSIVAMMGMHLIATITRHNRADKEAHNKSIAEAKNALKKALKDNPDDINLHAALHRTVQRLRKHL